MSAIYLSDADLQPLISYADAIELVEAALKDLAAKKASNRPRQRVRTDKSGLNVLVAAHPGGGCFGFKAYSSGPGSPGMFNWLYKAEDGSNRSHDFQRSQQQVARSRLVFNRVLVSRVRARNVGDDLRK